MLQLYKLYAHSHLQEMSNQQWQLHLMRHSSEAVSKSRLADYLYPHDDDRDSNVIEVLIGRLRKKLDPDGSLKPIETLRNRGYRFTLCDTE